MRASNGRTLDVIPIPPDGTVAYLKDVMQQAIVYIRPIQKCLSVESGVTASETVSYAFTLKAFSDR